MQEEGDCHSFEIVLSDCQTVRNGISYSLILSLKD